MILQDFKPGSMLAEYVQCFRIVDFRFVAGNEIPFKLYPPKPENCLHFFLKDPFYLGTEGRFCQKQPTVLFTGQQTNLLRQLTGNEFLDVQVVFQGTAMYRIFGIPAYELTDQHIDATALFPKALVSQILDRLQHADDYTSMISIVGDFITSLTNQRLQERHLIDSVVKRIHEGSLSGDTTTFANESCLSSKQFERKFYQRVGVTPRGFVRIVRFNKVFNNKNRYPDRSWLRIALEGGYHDYQHLVKDYQYFTGLSPTALHEKESRSPENVLGLSFNVYKLRAKS